MKKNIGNVLALYPTPAVVVGTEVNGKVNWLLVAHVGIIGHDRIMLSLFKKHYTNEGIRQTGKVSVNMVNEAMLGRGLHERRQGGQVGGLCLSQGGGRHARHRPKSAGHGV